MSHLFSRYEKTPLLPRTTRSANLLSLFSCQIRAKQNEHEAYLGRNWTHLPDALQGRIDFEGLTDLVDALGSVSAISTSFSRVNPAEPVVANTAI